MPTPTRILVVDDEAPARQRLIRLLGDLDGTEVVGEAENGIVALEQIEALAPDLVFLDIEMPGLDGLEVARTLAARDAGPAVIFATAYDEHALAAFDAAAVDYLVKPIARERLTAAVERVIRRPPALPSPAALAVARPSVRLAIKSGNRYVICPVAEVSAILAEDHYATVIWGDRELLADESLDALGARLDPERFLRVHRSALINLDFLAELVRQGDRKYLAQLGDRPATRVPVSRERWRALKAHLGI